MSKFLRWSWMIFIIKGFWTIVFIFIVISTTFRPICPLAFFRCLSNSGAYMELWTTSFIESKGVACSDSVSHNRVQVLSIPVLLLACCQDWTCNLQMIVSLESQGTNVCNRYAMCRLLKNWPCVTSCLSGGVGKNIYGCVCVYVCKYTHTHGSAHGGMVNIVGIRTVTRVQILDEVVCL